MAAREAGRGALAQPGVPLGEPAGVLRLCREGRLLLLRPGFPAPPVPAGDGLLYLPVPAPHLPAPPSSAKGVRYLSPLASEVPLTHLEIRHILGNSGELAGMTSFCSFFGGDKHVQV